MTATTTAKPITAETTAPETELEGLSKRQEKLVRGLIAGVAGAAVIAGAVWGAKLAMGAAAAGVPFYMLKKATIPAGFVVSVCYKLAYEAWTGKEYKDPAKVPTKEELTQNAEDMKATIAALERQVADLSRNVENKMDGKVPAPAPA